MTSLFAVPQLMHVIIFGFVGAVAGLLGCVLTAWIPNKILEQEAAWIASVTANDRQQPTSLGFSKFLSGYKWLTSETFIMSVVCALMSGILAAQFASHTEISNVVQLAMMPRLWEWMVFCWIMAGLAQIDFKTQLLPDALTQPLLWAGLILQLHPQTRTAGLEASLMGVMVGYSILWLTRHFYFILRGQEGLGLGDVKLMAAIGAWLGPSAVPITLSIGALAGLIWQLTAIKLGYTTSKAEFAFGPWLIVGALICLLLINGIF